MGKGDNRRTFKMKRRKAQTKKKLRETAQRTGSSKKASVAK